MRVYVNYNDILGFLKEHHETPITLSIKDENLSGFAGSNVRSEERFVLHNVSSKLLKQK